MYTFIKKHLARTPLRNAHGGVMIEFAFAMPVLILVLLGGIELGRFMLLHQKLDRTAMTVSDLVARVSAISTSEIDTVFTAADLVMSPFDLADRGRVIISSVKEDSGSPKVIWQRSGAGSLSVTSSIGTTGGTAAIGDPSLVTDTDAIVIGETFFEYSPWFISLIPSTTLHHIAIFRPRLSNEVTCIDC